MKLFVPFSVIDALEDSSENDLSFGEFEYDHISDEHIQSFITSGKASAADLAEDWELKDGVDFVDYHAERTACIVLLMQSGVELDPVEMELSEHNRNTNYVVDGNHRIRASRFLKKQGFLANLGGYERMMLSFKELCKKGPTHTRSCDRRRTRAR
jgi:rhodanese-related sulfurtransferase